MEKQNTGLGISPKHNRRAATFILGLFILFLILLVPITVSLAQGSEESYKENDYNDGSVGVQLNYSEQITATATLTPSSTPTETGTPTITPTSTETQTSTPTATLTATETSTSTSTASETPTVTGTPSTETPTATSTMTGTPPTVTRTPTPTGTGTPTGIPTLKVTVAPTEAKVNQTFTFTIEAGNNGTVSTDSNMVLDSFPTYIDVLTVTTSRGTITKLTHSFAVVIGEIVPNEKITIIATVKVNSTLARTETLANVVALNYDVSKSITASVNYKVIFQALPPTGDLPLNWRDSQIKPVGLIPGVLLMILGMVLLLIGIWSKVNNRQNTLWMVAIGSLLVVIGFVAGATAMGVFQPPLTSSSSVIQPTTDMGLEQLSPDDQSVTNIQRLPAAAFSTPEAVVQLETLPNYPIPTPVITVTPKPGEAAPDISAVVRISIPSLMLDTVVKYVPYDGYSWMISGLKQEVAWMGNTSWPGLGGNTGLAGHVTVSGMGDGPFRHLDELPDGELVILYTENNMYTYHVRERKVTDDSDMSVTQATDNPQITLITCIDWDDTAHTYLHRLVVFADLVRTEPITMGYVP